MPVDALARKWASRGGKNAWAASAGVVTAAPPSGADDYGSLQALFTAASGGGALNGLQNVVIRKGIYLVSQTLILSSHLTCEPGVVFKATASMSAVMSVGGSAGNRNGGDINGRVWDIDITNLKIDCNDLATDGLWLRGYARVMMDRLRVVDCPRYAVRLGDAATSLGGFEALFMSPHFYRTKGTIQAGSVGIFGETNGTDTLVEGAPIIRDFETAVDLATPNNQINNVHCWAYPTFGVMKDGFRSRAGKNRFSNCQADTVSRYCFNLDGFKDELVQCTGYNNSLSGSDNVVIGIHCAQASPEFRISQFTLLGQASNRFARDCDATNFGTCAIFGSTNENVVLVSMPPMAVSNTTGSLQFTGDTLAFSRTGTNYIGAASSGGELRFQARGGGGSPKDICQTDGANGYMQFHYGIRIGNGGSLTNMPYVLSGNGSPEGVVSAVRASLYMRLDGAAGTTLYVKESASGNTGWVAK